MFSRDDITDKTEEEMFLIHINLQSHINIQNKVRSNSEAC